MPNLSTDPKLRPFEISADRGNTWTRQFLTFSEAKEEVNYYSHLVRLAVMQQCETCGSLFWINYYSNGTYTYCADVCDCESDFKPFRQEEPTILEFMEFIRKREQNIPKALKLYLDHLREKNYKILDNSHVALGNLIFTVCEEDRQIGGKTRHDFFLRLDP